MTAAVDPTPEFDLVRRRDSRVAHAVHARSVWSLCGHRVDQPGDRGVEPGAFPLCKRCARRLGRAPQ